jgi:hypothetical protein
MPEPRRGSQSTLRSINPFALIAFVLVVSILIVNPFREMLSQDDSWAYARMVEHTIATGRYQPDAFTAANMPVQIYLAACLARIFGYSFTLLRFTTLGFLLIALISFYLLLCEFGYTQRVAAVVTVALLASPLVLILGFTFMSDIQFLGWLLLALLLYVRGFRRRSGWEMLCGSIAAGCAIGTRQFGMALILGLGLAWLLSRPSARPPLRLIAIAVVIPLLATVMQFYISLRSPGFIQSERLAATRHYWSLPFTLILRELIWRLAIIAQYLGMAILPLLPLTLRTSASFWKQPFLRMPLWLITAIACAALVITLSHDPFAPWRSPTSHHIFWQPLQIDWLLPTNFGRLPAVERLLDLGGIVGALSLLGVALDRFRSLGSLRNLRPEILLLVGAVAGLLLLHLFYVQLNDTYMISFLPFTLLLVADRFRTAVPSRMLLRLSAVISVIFIIACSYWVRSEYDYQQQLWAAADDLHHSGVAPADIDAYFNWSVYHGAFDDWIAAGHPDPWFEWLRQRWSRAPYVVAMSPSPDPPPGCRLLASRPYYNAARQRRYVLTMQRISSP